MATPENVTPSAGSNFPTPFGKYLLTELLAVGGMAEVYRAKIFGVDGFEKEMVVKKILPKYAKKQSFVQMFVDEAQNLTPHEVKTIISRAGDNTKIVLTGDPYQIDNPYVDSTNNGLVHTVNRFKSERIFGHVTLMKGERSELAELATTLL